MWDRGTMSVHLSRYAGSPARPQSRMWKLTTCGDPVAAELSGHRGKKWKDDEEEEGRGRGK
jgi:hypothetical protein